MTPRSLMSMTPCAPKATATSKGLANYDKASAWATTALSLADTKRKL